MARATGAADRLLRLALMLVVMVVLVVGLVAALVAVTARWTRGPVLPAAAVCRAEVTAPGDDGVLRAELTPERMANAALVVGLADRRGLPARAATIAVATAIQESGLRNLDYGDRDSLGLFQQRPSQGWGTDEQVQDPLYATGAFYDALVQVDGYTELEITDAAQRVQRSGFPQAYADHEREGRALASSLYGLSPAALVCELPPVDDMAGDATAAAPPEAAAALVGELQTWATGGWRASAVEAAAPPGDGPAGGSPTEDGSTGTGAAVVLDASAAADPGRTAWALAHSAVALAERHGVVRVEVDGQVWDRSQPDLGWAATAADASAEPSPVAPGSGLVRVVTG